MNDLFLRACRREPVERPPVWIMRQAGRYLPEYRAVREKVDFVTLCRTPELVTEVTLQPIDRLGVDAAILFSDILIPALGMGLGLDFTPGPVIDRPVRAAEDVDRLADADPREVVPYVYDAIRMLRRELDGRVPLIGFAAAPFTFAAYIVEGKGTKNFETTKAMMHREPALFHRLLEKVAATTARYVAAQVEAGAQAVQLFDTWAGLLDEESYREFALRHVSSVLESLAESGVPRIYFALDAFHLAGAVRESAAEVLGVDWRVKLDLAAKTLGESFCLQGNLDPTVLFADRRTVVERTRAVLEAGRAAGGHVFNLGHGILPGTPVENAQAVVETVRAYRPV